MPSSPSLPGLAKKVTRSNAQCEQFNHADPDHQHGECYQYLLRCVRSRPIDPVFSADSVVLAISAEKDGNCGWSTPGSDAAKVVLLGEVLKLRWRGPTPPLRVTLG
jgi:hypothetical protein